MTGFGLAQIKEEGIPFIGEYLLTESFLKEKHFLIVYSRKGKRILRFYRKPLKCFWAMTYGEMQSYYRKLNVKELAKRMKETSRISRQHFINCGYSN